MARSLEPKHIVDDEPTPSIERLERSMPFRQRAAVLQERLPQGTVSAATSNGWKGAYCIVDFDTLEALCDLIDSLRAVEP